MTEPYSFPWWMAVAILVLLVAFTAYKIFVLHQPAYLNFAFISVLALLIIKETPLFIKYSFLNVIFIVIAAGFFIWEVVLALKK